MPVHSFASRLVPTLLIFALAGSVFGAERLSKKKTRNPHRTSASADDDEEVTATPPDSRRSPEGQREGVTTKASLETSGYSDSDAVYVASPSIGANFSDEVAGWSLGGHYLVDVVSAASVDIVSTASSHWVEVRHVGSFDGGYKFGDVDVSGSGSISKEPDYTSVTFGGNVTFDLLEKNLTPFIGVSVTSDDVGRTGLPHELWKDKTTTSGRLGFTFVVDSSTIASLQVDGIRESGYLAKPYRFVPLFAPGEGGSIIAGAPIDVVNAQRVNQRPIEQLPQLRNRFAATGRIAHRFGGSTIRADERLYNDSWGQRASTTDVRYTMDIGQRWMLWPHVRLHVQNSVTFWKRAYELVDIGGTLGVPELRTGDRELSSLYTLTVGFGTRFKFADDWALLFETDVGYTRYFDALYISDRRAIFSTLGIEAEF